MLFTTACAPLALLLAPAGLASNAGTVEAQDARIAAPITHVALAARIGSALVGRENASLGVLEDVVVARENGKVTHAIVSTDGRRAIVADPLALFRWDGKANRWSAPIDTAEAAEWTAFPEGGIDALIAEQRAVDASAARGEAKLAAPLFLATELLGSPVALTGDPFGSVTDLVLGLGRRSVEFVVVSTEAAPQRDPNVAPWPAVTFDAEGALVLNLGRLAIEEAPRLAKGDTRSLLDPKLRTAVYEFYGVREPARMKAGGKKTAQTDRGTPEAN